jgi:hypothetical protein
VRAKGSFDQCCCPDDIVATAQALVDQLVGSVVMIEAGAIPITPLFLINQSKRLADFMQAYIDDYVKHHGLPDPAHQVAAADSLMKTMLG